jgi:BirA family biotin operon repressor/biotin-[acetyl-CoA-carboxylase] ligase
MTAASPDPWNLSLLQAMLQARHPQATVEHFPEIDSTNAELMRRARAGDTRTCLLLADQQTAGRGRLGRQWHSRAGDALTFSLGLTLAPTSWSGLSLAVGCCLAEALDPLHDKGLGLKWPNDLMLGASPAPRKLGGILIETVLRQGDASLQRYVVIGIGLNLVAPPAGDYRTEPAGLQQVLGSPATPSAVLQLVLPELIAGLGRFSAKGFASFAPAFARRDLLLGQALEGSNGLHGSADGVDHEGVLWLNTANGRVPVSSDEVSLRRVGTS